MAKLVRFLIMKRIVVVFFTVAVFAKHEEYIGWKSYYVEPSTGDQLAALGGMIPVYELDFLSQPTVEREGIVLVKPQYLDPFVATLKNEGISFRIHVDDVKAQLDIEDQLIEQQVQEKETSAFNRLPYDNYQPLEVVNRPVSSRYRQQVQRYNFWEIVTLVSPANSFEGHPIRYLKISSTEFKEDIPVIVIDGGMDGREWIAPATVTYIVHKLVEDLAEKDLLKDFDWILLPVANPNGYKFSFDSSRFWRKTRSTDQRSRSINCLGVDGKRNFDFFWNTLGYSSNPCADTFSGTKPFSEVETRVVRDILHEHLDRISLYITLHGFGSMILYPWGNNGNISSNAGTLHNVGIEMADAIDKNFTKYVVGNSLLVLGYGVSGTPEDYAHKIGVPLTYSLKLPGLDSETPGFLVNPRHILQVFKGTWDAFVVGARRSGELFMNRRKQV